jgi:ectoine hydroxylase-related dioxygenase (phytanoyl-CoA dioxygenase family)
MVLAFERLLLDPARYPGDEVTIHHRKLIMKDKESYCPPEQDSTGEHAGNRFQWHQDYYYWGDHTTTGGDAYGGPGRPFADIATCAIALDPATPENGCIQVLRGSHRFGQLPFVAEQWGERHARPDVVEGLLAKGCEVVHCQLSPGDAVLFHCEILHQSFANPTDNPRWAFLCAYDTMHNVPNWGEDLRRPARTWDDARVLTAAEEHLQVLMSH